MQVALIDHYDSFTFNVIDWLRTGDQSIEVVYAAHDDEAALRHLVDAGLPLVLSPGPKRPEDATSTMALAAALLGKVPILGICLGHQILARLAGASIVQARAPFHGSTREIRVGPVPGLLAGLGPAFQAAVYHSLAAEPGTLAMGWEINASCEDGDIQALSREIEGQAPAYGLQFHPESFLSADCAPVIRRNWLAALMRWDSGGRCGALAAPTGSRSRKSPRA
jgi:anthranilate synthase/aminodeoxychorismate synthase-like glutamine amidotransferase